jgi:transcriptional regulator with XRE-family HTH domain
MWQVHHEIVRMKILGFKATEIAEKLNVSVQMVSYTLNSEVVKDKLAVMEGARDADTVEVAKEIAKMFPKALKVYDKILDEEEKEDEGKHAGASLGLQKMTADRVLEIGGHGPVRRVDARHAHAHAHFTADEIKEIKERGKVAAEQSGEIIDVEVEEVAEV